MPHQLQTVCKVILKKKKTKVKIFTHLLLGRLRLVVAVVWIFYNNHRHADMRYPTHSKMPLRPLFFSPHKFRIEMNNFLFSSLIMVYATELPDAIHRQNEVKI